MVHSPESGLRSIVLSWILICRNWAIDIWLNNKLVCNNFKSARAVLMLEALRKYTHSELYILSVLPSRGRAYWYGVSGEMFNNFHSWRKFKTLTCHFHLIWLGSWWIRLHFCVGFWEWRKRSWQLRMWWLHKQCLHPVHQFCNRTWNVSLVFRILRINSCYYL